MTLLRKHILRKRTYLLFAVFALALCCIVRIMIPANEIYDFGPDWSPQGEAIVFMCHRPILEFTLFGHPDGDVPNDARTREICKMAADGRQRTYLTDNKMQDTIPRFSPDGKHIAFIRNEDLSWYLYLMSSDGSQQHRIGSLSDVSRLGWSPDSTQIAFKYGSKGLYVLDVQTRVERWLVPRQIEYFAWSPDSEQIAFVSRIKDECTIHIVRADAGNETRSPFGSACEPIAWSPNGKYLAFLRSEGIQFEGWLRHAANLDAGEVFTLTRKRQFSGDFLWSSDSDRIYYSAGGELFVAPIDGRGETQLTTDLKGSLIDYYGQLDLALSPDGRQLVFPRSEPENQRAVKIWRINTDGSGLQRLSP